MTSSPAASQIGRRSASEDEARRGGRARGASTEARGAAGVVPIARCREVLGPAAADWSDEDILALRERLSYLADVANQRKESE